jgi:assimilatory nitrate reductase catalytic subunit
MLYTEEFAHSDGKARFHAVIPESPPVVTDDEYPMILTTGRVLAHYLSGNQTMRIESQRSKVSEPVLEVHPATAAVVGLVAGRPARLVSRQGSATVAWVANPDLREDTLFLPYHWAPANALTASDLDPIAKIPGLKYTPVDIHPEPSTASSADAVADRLVFV